MLNRRVGVRTCGLLFLLGIAAAGSAQSAAEIEALHARIDAQAAEIAALRAIVQRLDRASATPPVTAPVANSSTPDTAPDRSEPQPLMAGTGAIRFNGVLQGWLAGGDSGFQDTFRIRRAELRFTGELGRTAGWNVMIDPAKMLGTVSGEDDTTVNQATRPLQDAFITVGRPARIALTAGQFKIPISREGLDPSAGLDVVERALFLSDRSRGGNYGDVRDIGVALRRSVARYDLTVGIFNGTGESQGETDRNDEKAIIGKLVVRVPGVAGLQLGASGAAGGGHGDARRDRAGLDLMYVRGPWKLKSEVTAGRDAGLERFGFYLHGGYRITPRLEIVGRLDQWDPDTDRDTTAASARERDYLAGANLSLTEGLRLQGNLVRKTFAGGGAADRNLLLINLQTSW